jgi:hypothetical protein
MGYEEFPTVGSMDQEPLKWALVLRRFDFFKFHLLKNLQTTSETFYFFYLFIRHRITSDAAIGRQEGGE